MLLLQFGNSTLQQSVRQVDAVATMSSQPEGVSRGKGQDDVMQISLNTVGLWGGHVNRCRPGPPPTQNSTIFSSDLHTIYAAKIHNSSKTING